MVGRQAEASRTSGVMASFLNTLPRPVRTLVAVMKSLIGARASSSKSISLGQNFAQRIAAHRVQIVGRHQARHEVHGDIDRRRIQRPAAEQHVEWPAPERAEARRLGDAAPEILERRFARRRRRLSAWPWTSTAAFIAPADVPEMPSISSHGSSSSRSSTPQVKAPCDPPPCSARSTRSGSRVMEAIGIGPHNNAYAPTNRLASCRERLLSGLRRG